ncbi:MAG: hypothetical protein MSC31_01010 [Solirubrobacteraceae bacterium MAG38_C4-C5]|nr:hypothetical protein [Candidatus Siliceabacter maunaloa]
MVAVSGCGGSGLDRAEVGKRLQDSCERAVGGLTEREESGARVDTAEIVAAYERVGRSIAGLEAGPEVAADVERYVAALDERLEVLRQVSRRASAGPPTEAEDAAYARLFARGDRAAAEMTRHAAALEAPACGG